MRFVLKCFLLCLLFLPVITVNAQDRTPEATPEATAEMSQVAWIRFTHVSADTGNIDVYLDGELVTEDLAFLGVSDYMPVDEGTHEVAFVPTGEDIDAALQKRSGALTAEHTYIIGASGLQASESFSMFVLDETSMMDTAYESASQMGERDLMGWFIVLHAIENGPALSIVFQTGETVASDLEFGGYYASPVVPGNYPIVVMTADGQDVVFNQLNPIDIRSGLLYFVVMTGTADDPQILVSISGTKTIQEILASSDTLTTFTDIVETAGLNESLSTEGPFTVFAPSNGAFESAEGFDAEYHIVPGLYHLNDIKDAETLTTLSGGEITVGNSATDNSQISILLNDIPLEFSGVLAINGIVYVVNSVLTPGE